MKTRPALILFLIIAILGCKPKGRVETRTACEIEAGTDGRNTAWFRYIGYEGLPLEQPGLKMVTHLPDGGRWYVPASGNSGDTDGIWIESNGITNSGGSVLAFGRRNWESFPELFHMTGAFFEKPGSREGCSTVGAYMEYATEAEKPNEWASATATNTTPKWLERIKKAGLEYNTTDQEWAAVVSGTGPEKGIDYEVALVQQKGSVGNGYSEQVTGLVPCNFTELDDIFYYSYPMAYSFIVKTSKPVDLTENVFYAKVKTQAFPDGATVEIAAFLSNDTQTVHVLRTDFFVLNQTEYFLDMIGCYDDPNNLCDPNFIEPLHAAVYDRWTPVDGIDYGDGEYYAFPDFTATALDLYSEGFNDSEHMDPERIKPCWIIPIDEDDHVEIEFIVDDSTALKSLSSWMTDDALYDFNGDGIFNLKDYIVLFQ